MNAAVVPDLFPLRVAAHRALASLVGGALRTRSIHTELVFNLSGSRHVSDAQRRGAPESHVSLLPTNMDG